MTDPDDRGIMAMSEHTSKAFDSDLQDLSRMVAEMGGLAEKQIADAVDALAKRDTTLAQRVTGATPTSTTCSARSRRCRC